VHFFSDSDLKQIMLGQAKPHELYHLPPHKTIQKFKFDHQVLKKTCHLQSLAKDHFHEFKNINNMHWVIIVKYTMHCKQEVEFMNLRHV
jgi:hypothetical protein